MLLRFEQTHVTPDLWNVSKGEKERLNKVKLRWVLNSVLPIVKFLDVLC